MKIKSLTVFVFSVILLPLQHNSLPWLHISYASVSSSNDLPLLVLNIASNIVIKDNSFSLFHLYKYQGNQCPDGIGKGSMGQSVRIILVFWVSSSSYGRMLCFVYFFNFQTNVKISKEWKCIKKSLVILLLYCCCHFISMKMMKAAPCRMGWSTFIVYFISPLSAFQELNLFLAMFNSGSKRSASWAQGNGVKDARTANLPIIRWERMKES